VRIVTVPRPIAERVARFDQAVDGLLDHWRGNPVTDRVFYGASAAGDHSLIWLMLATARGLRSKESHWPAAVRAAAGIGAESAIVNLGIKSLFRRDRPVYEGLRPLPLRRPRTSSFPSGHATAAFCAAALLSDDDPLWPLYYALAFVVAWSRAYVRIHHPSDVVAGMVVGAALGRLARRIVPLPPGPSASDHAGGGIFPASAKL
jgi:membrane-associated phospholipid phosphatase